MPFLHPGKFHLNFLSAVHHSVQIPDLCMVQSNSQEYKMTKPTQEAFLLQKWLGQTSLCNSFVPKVKTLKVNAICVFSGLKPSRPTSIRQIQLKSYLQDTLLLDCFQSNITTKGDRWSDSPFIDLSILHPFFPLWWWFAMWLSILGAVRWFFWPCPSFLSNQNEIKVKCRVCLFFLHNKCTNVLTHAENLEQSSS